MYWISHRETIFFARYRNSTGIRSFAEVRCTLPPVRYPIVTDGVKAPLRRGNIPSVSQFGNSVANDITVRETAIPYRREGCVVVLVCNPAVRIDQFLMQICAWSVDGYLGNVR
jgi:hypothetical protein